MVCPLGFWCMSKVIECHAHARDPGEEIKKDFALLSEPTASRNALGQVDAIVLAASDRVNSFPGSLGVAALFDALEDATHGKAALAETWGAWVEAVRQLQPSLLVVLPHTLEDQTLPVLEVSQAARLFSSQVEAAHVGGADGRRHIVLLLGCATGNLTTPYVRFPAAFRDAGAAIVLATLSKILGRHAAPVAKRLVEALVERAGKEDTTFGDVMLDVRREMLAAGLPMVLALTAYGDTDWVLGPGRN